MRRRNSRFLISTLVLAMVLLSVPLVGCGGSSITSGQALKVTLNDVYFTDGYFPYQATPYMSMLSVDLTLRNTGDDWVCIKDAYLQDSLGTVTGMSIGSESGTLCLTPGETTKFTAVDLGTDVPRDGRGLKLVIVPDDIKNITVSLPNTGSIRVEKGS